MKVDCQGSSVHGILHARISGYLTEDLTDPWVEPGSPALQADFLPSEPPGKPYIYIYIYVKNNIYVYIYPIYHVKYSKTFLKYVLNAAC